MTVRELLTKAFKSARILGAGESMDADDADDGFDILNAIIEETNIDKTLAFYQTNISFPLVPNQTVYTIGPAITVPDVVAPRPVEILGAFARRGNTDLPMFVGSQDDYNGITTKTVGVAGWAQAIYYEATFPKGTMHIYQTPLDTSTAIFISVMAEIAAFATLSDVLSLPPGYRFWLQYKTAERLASEYAVPWVKTQEDILTKSEIAVKSNNIKPMPVARTGLVSLGSSGGKYNVFSDGTR